MNSVIASFYFRKSFLTAFLTGIIMMLHSCQSDKESKSHLTIIKGKIQDPKSDKIYFYSYSDSAAMYLENKTALDSEIVDRKGNFSFSLAIHGPTVFDLESGGKNLTTNLLVCSGDKIEIYFADSNNTANIKESTPAGKFNSFLVKFRYAFYQEPAIKTEYYIGSNYMDGHNFGVYNKKRKNAQIEFFYKFFEGDSLRKEYHDYALSTIQYGIGVDRLMYVWKKRMKNETVVLDSNYFDFETSSFLENKNAFNCPAYIHFLKLYIKDEYEQMLVQGELPVDKSKKLIPAVEKYNLSMNLLNRPFRDVVIYNIILSDMNDITNHELYQFSAALPLDSMIKKFKQKYLL